MLESYGRWELGPIRNKCEIVGCKARCREHFDADGKSLECYKRVRIGKSRLSYETLRLRMKRWLIAGLDDDEWEEDNKRGKHVAMGGKYLHEFSEGLSEEACDRIANSR